MIEKLMEFAATHVANKIFKDYYYNHPEDFGDVNMTALGFMSKALESLLVTLELEEIIKYDTWEKCCSLITTTFRLDKPTCKKEKLRTLLTDAIKYAENHYSENGKFPLDIRVKRFDKNGKWDVVDDSKIFSLDEFDFLYEYIENSYGFDCEIYVNYKHEAVTTDCGVMLNYNKFDDTLTIYFD